MADRRQAFVILAQGVEGVRISGDNFLGSHFQNRFGVMLLYFLKKHLLAKTPYLVASVLFLLAKDTEILVHVVEKLCGFPVDFYDPVIVGANTVDKKEGIRSFAALQQFHWHSLGKLFLLNPFTTLFCRFAIGVAPFLQGVERLLQGLRYHALINQTATQINYLINVLDRQGAFFFTGTTGRARPNFVFRIDTADQSRGLLGLPPNRKGLEQQIPCLDRDEAWRQGTLDSIGRALVRTAAAISTAVKIQHVFPGEILKLLDPKGFQVIQFFLGQSVAHRLDRAPVEPQEQHVEERGQHMEVFTKGQKAEEIKKRQVMHIV